MYHIPDSIRRILSKTHVANWLVTGVAGFIGSNLLENLLKSGQCVVGLDNLSTGKQSNLDDVQRLVTPEQWGQFKFRRGDVGDLAVCQEACRGVGFVLHQAALGSVPRSIEDPVATHEANVTGFLNMLMACRDNKVKRLVYASSSSVYGDNPALPKREGDSGKPLSPYALSKLVDEQYAQVFHDVYGMQTIGLRYFNVFGPRQDPQGAYAAVMPRWIGAMLKGEPVVVYGDGETSRDFCYVDNVVEANLLAALTDNPKAVGEVYNVSVGGRTSLKELFAMMRGALGELRPEVMRIEPVYEAQRQGDVPHSQADIGKIMRDLGYKPVVGLAEGLKQTVAWFNGFSTLAHEGE